MASNQLSAYPAPRSTWFDAGGVWKPTGPVPKGDCAIAHNFQNGARHFIVQSPDPTHDPDFQALVSRSPNVPIMMGLSDGDKTALESRYPDAVENLGGNPATFLLLLVKTGGPLVDITPLAGTSSQQTQSRG
jgi:hypothetical protein